MKRAAKWALTVICLVFYAALLAAMVSNAAKAERRIDCSLASFHPDYTPAMREKCKK